MLPEDSLDQILQRFEFLEAQLSAGADGADFVRISKEYAELRPVVEVIKAYRQTRDDLRSR